MQLINNNHCEYLIQTNHALLSNYNNEVEVSAFLNAKNKLTNAINTIKAYPTKRYWAKYYRPHVGRRLVDGWATVGRP